MQSWSLCHEQTHDQAENEMTNNHNMCNNSKHAQGQQLFTVDAHHYHAARKHTEAEHKSNSNDNEAEKTIDIETYCVWCYVRMIAYLQSQQIAHTVAA